MLIGKFVLVALLLWRLAVQSAIAADPPKKQEFRSVAPGWVTAGQAGPVQVYGQDLNPKEIVFEQAGLTAKVIKVETLTPKTDDEKKKGNTAVQVEITAPASLKPGTYNFKLRGPGVETATGQIYVDTPAPEVQSVEPNDSLFAPQVLPHKSVTVLGKLDDGADVFQIDGKAGETWRFEVFARRLKPDTKLEPVLRLRDARRTPLRVAVDQGADCFIEYTLPASGAYLLELFDGDTRAEGGFVYRLAVRLLS